MANEPFHKRCPRQDGRDIGNLWRDHANDVYDARWNAVRSRMIHRWPVCANPLGLHVQDLPATEVHHIRPVRSGGAVLDEWNLIPLCARCHVKIHRRMARHGEQVIKKCIKAAIRMRDDLGLEALPAVEVFARIRG
jgi:5-methylcytosine-specific restriction endonuclease McrA